jgi:hypothetical protein
MAIQVADSFISCGEAEAIRNTADHLKSFCYPRMRRQIEVHLMGAKDAAARKSA